MGVTEKARNTDLQTSWDAAARADLPGSQQVVLDVLERIGETTQDGIWQYQATFDVAPRAYSPSRIRTAVCELVRAGRVQDTGRKYTNPWGRHETIWRLT